MLRRCGPTNRPLAPELSAKSAEFQARALSVRARLAPRPAKSSRLLVVVRQVRLQVLRFYAGRSLISVP